MKPRRVKDIEAARTAAVYSYARMHDRFSEMEQVFTWSGAVYEAEGAHQYARIALRAYKAETDDPEPQT